jgi:hypothetical protein
VPIHDWKRVPAGIFHHFHHDWITEIARTLNRGLLGNNYYALAEQMAGGFGPDVLALEELPRTRRELTNGTGAQLVLTPPKTRFTLISEGEFYRRKKSAIAIRHVSGDRLVAMVEIVSPGNKAGRVAFEAFVTKAAELLECRIHLLIVDLFPPTRRDPEGVHSSIWDEVRGESFRLPRRKRLTLVSYECNHFTKAHVEPVAVGDQLPDMPIFLEPGAHVPVPLARTYDEAFSDLPRRWRSVLKA